MKTTKTAAAAALAVLCVVLAFAGRAEAATTQVGALSQLDLTQSRAAGHADLQLDGLHIWTDDATSQAKVAGYLAVSQSLGSIAAGAAPAVDYAAASGIAPGLQLVFSWSGHTAILVGEAVYGDKWWVSDLGCAPWCAALPVTWSPGGGSVHSATLAEWSAAMPGAQVNAFGFSLGSGVHAAGVLKSMVLAGVTFKFKLKVATQPTATSPAPPTTSAATSSEAVPTRTATPTTPASSSAVAVPVTNQRPRGTSGTDTENLAYTGTAADPAWIGAIAVGLILVGGAGIILVQLRRRKSRR